MTRWHFEDLGLIDYKEAWDYQENLMHRVIENRNTPSESVGYLLTCEHPHVFTLGRSGAEDNLLINQMNLAKLGATFHRTNRGGDITYHGPGQVVVYPIFDLQKLNIGVKEYVAKLEDAVMETLKPYGLFPERMEGASGVWLDPISTGHERKLCAIGVRVSRFVTMHGLALNVNTDLNFFNLINPCGFTNKGVTSMQKELGMQINFDVVKNKLKDNITSLFQL